MATLDLSKSNVGGRNPVLTAFLTVFDFGRGYDPVFISLPSECGRKDIASGLRELADKIEAADPN